MDDGNEELSEETLKGVSGGGPRESMQMEYELYKRNGGTLSITVWLQRGRPSR